jgi:hypothetical protein
LVKKFGVRVISYHRPVKNEAGRGCSGCGAIGAGGPIVAQDVRLNNKTPSKTRFICNLQTSLHKHGLACRPRNVFSGIKQSSRLGCGA